METSSSTTSTTNKRRRSRQQQKGKPLPFEMLLALPPFAGIFNTMTVRFQSWEQRHVNDQVGGLWREFWTGGRPPIKPRLQPGHPNIWSLTYRPTGMYMVLQQLIENNFGLQLSVNLFRRLLIWRNNRRRSSIKQSDKNSERSTTTLSRLDAERGNFETTGLFVGFLVTKSVILAGLSLIAHPFSIVRTVIMKHGDLPLRDQGFMANLRYALPFNNDNLLYSSSIGAHVASVVADTCLSDLIGSAALRAAISKDLIPQLKKSPDHQEEQGAAPKGKHELLLDRLHSALIINTLKVISSFAARTIVYPLFTIRARLEGQGPFDGEPTTQIAFRGAIDCAGAIWEQEGLAGFYRGFASHSVSLVAQLAWMSVVYGISYGIIVYEQDEQP